MEYSPDIEALKTAWRYFVRVSINEDRERDGYPPFAKEEMDEQFNRMLGKVWQDGRDALALDMVKPEGFYPTTPNPFKKES